MSIQLVEKHYMSRGFVCINMFREEPEASDHDDEASFDEEVPKEVRMQLGLPDGRYLKEWLNEGPSQNGEVPNMAIDFCSVQLITTIWCSLQTTHFKFADVWVPTTSYADPRWKSAMPRLWWSPNWIAWIHSMRGAYHIVWSPLELCGLNLSGQGFRMQKDGESRPLAQGNPV